MIQTRIVRLDKLKPKEKLRFPADTEKILGIQGSCNVTVKSIKNITKVRETYTEKIFVVEYLETGGTLIKNLKTGESREFPNIVRVIAKSK